MARREHDQIGCALIAGIGRQPIGAILLRNIGDLAAQMAKADIREGARRRAEQLIHISPEGGTARISAAVIEHGIGIRRGFVGLAEPAVEMGRILGEHRHARGSHVDPVGRVLARIGESRTQQGPRLIDIDRDRSFAVGADQMDRKGRTGEPAADDGNARDTHERTQAAARLPSGASAFAVTLRIRAAAGCSSGSFASSRWLRNRVR